MNKPNPNQPMNTYYPYYPQMVPWKQTNLPQQFPQQQQIPFTPAYPPMPSGSVIQTPTTGPTTPSIPGMLPLEQSYIENILRLNRGKFVTVYFTFENNPEWNAKIFKGVVEAAGRDHLILSDPETGIRYLLPMVYFNYAVFEEELDYEYPFAGTPLATYTPR
ncbi:hypothetical protein B4064_2404 [Caldibacillus thermoamylovorans]|uniref:spore coat protein GerQ n=1 Tax=Caldibacillus thermoamylovorans TaxID=35841 RepID=UPI0005B6C203|nr:spore coat protein GerQ [Caldibacillus thermoamylovorans]KIO63310.1 hypothetical protein B4065_2978 [Caldibacillus thermoamylovorans]KIO65911.1 hypothetical protein B4064_2404 [Caldibacillus thermoamylovorans]